MWQCSPVASGRVHFCLSKLYLNANFSISTSLEYAVSNSLMQTYHVCKSVLLVFLRLKTDILITTFDSELDVNALNVKGGMVG